MSLGGDSRAVSTTVSYALTLTITTLLVTGLLIAGGDFVADQRDSATRNELRVIGQQLAADVNSADRLGRTASEDGDLEIERRLPDRVAGAAYRVGVRQVGSSDTYAFTLSTENPDIATETRVYSTVPVFTKQNLTGGTAAVSYNSVTEEVLVRDPGPYVFQAANDRVVIEAESYPENHPGSENASRHYWKAFDDTDANGDEAVIVRPDMTEEINTYDNLYGPRMEYRVNFESSETGTYYIWVRTKADDGEEDSVHVALREDGGSWEPGTFGGLGLGDDGDGDWDWANVITSSGGQRAQVTVNDAGTHTVAVWMREDGARIDKIILTESSAYDPNVDPVPAESEWG